MLTRLRFVLRILLTLAPAAAATAQGTINLGPGQVSTDQRLNGVTVNLDGGSIVSNGAFGSGASLTDGVLNINSGSISDGFQNSNSVVNLRGGSVGEFFANVDGSEVNISGGTIGSFGLFDGSTATITGGRVLRFPDVFAGSTVNIFGGDLFSVRLVNPNATANFFGSAFALNGVPLDLEIGETVSITPATGQNLSATLADGSPFEFDLNAFGPFGGANPDETAPGSIITVTLTPINGDYNADGRVDAADYTVWRDTLGQTVDTPFSAADGDGDGQIDADDFLVWRENFGAVSTPSAQRSAAVPEPATGLLVVALAPALASVRRRTVHP